MGRAFWLRASSALLILAMAACAVAPAGAQDPSAASGRHGGGRPVYQRHATGSWNKGGHDFKRGRHFPQFSSPQINSGWSQRPYPYHLDYYKMKWGGSYAPYFGNLYGPPQVVTAPPYFGPYYGNWGMGEGGMPMNGGYPGSGVPFESMPQMEGPQMVMPQGGQVPPQRGPAESLPPQ